jgi:hypothetical protein
MFTVVPGKKTYRFSARPSADVLFGEAGLPRLVTSPRTYPNVSLGAAWPGTRDNRQMVRRSPQEVAISISPAEFRCMSESRETRLLDSLRSTAGARTGLHEGWQTRTLSEHNAAAEDQRVEI